MVGLGFQIWPMYVSYTLHNIAYLPSISCVLVYVSFGYSISNKLFWASWSTCEGLIGLVSELVRVKPIYHMRSDKHLGCLGYIRKYAAQL